MGNKGNWQEVYEFLEGLGATPAAVAARFTKEDLKGVRLNKKACPVSNCIRKQFPDLDVVEVSPYRIFGENHTARTKFNFVPPAAVGNFALNFDNKQYPELEATGCTTS